MEKDLQLRQKKLFFLHVFLGPEKYPCGFFFCQTLKGGEREKDLNWPLCSFMCQVVESQSTPSPPSPPLPSLHCYKLSPPCNLWERWVRQVSVGVELTSRGQKWEEEERKSLQLLQALFFSREEVEKYCESFSSV